MINRRNIIKSALGFFGLSSVAFATKSSSTNTDRQKPQFWELKSKQLDYIYTIEETVLDWLEKQNTPSIEFRWDWDTDFKHIKTLCFHRSEINIKTASNVWEVWHIASCTDYPKIISYKKKTIGTNEMPNGFTLPNEIRPMNYSPEYNDYPHANSSEVKRA